MTDAELIARLRKADEYETLGHDGWEAADRIELLATTNEQLVATNEALVKEREALHAAIEQLQGPLTVATLVARAEAAEAKVEALVKERDEYKKLAIAGEMIAHECRILGGQAEAAEAALKEAVGVIQSCPPTSYPHISPSAHLDNINTWWRIWVRPFLAKHGSQK